MTTRSPTTPDGWGVTLAFWATLLVAGSLFMAASLAPRLAMLADQQEEYAANQRQLIELEQRAESLERIARAAQDDPTFAKELARTGLALDQPGSHQLSVPAALQPDAGAIADEPPSHGVPPRMTLALSAIRPLADDVRLRFSVLGLASFLVVMAFAVLNDARAATSRAIKRHASAFGRGIVARYRRPDSR